MDLVRHKLGFADLPELFPKKGTCLAIHSRKVNSGASLSEVLKRNFPSYQKWKPELEKLSVGYISAKQEQNVLDYDDLLL